MDVRIGSRFRALRQRLAWRQLDLGRKAGVSRSLVSLLERGHIERLSIASVRRIAQALDAELVVQLRWRGGELDRLLDEGHAALAGAIVNVLRQAGWTVRVEVSYSVYGERGSIDVLAWHPGARSLLVAEVKTELPSVEATIRKHDEKARLAARIAADEFGWRAAAVARLLVLPEHSTPRRRVQRHADVMSLAYPARGHELRRWVARPEGPLAGLLFLAVEPRRNGVGLSRKRIRRRALAA